MGGELRFENLEGLRWRSAGTEGAQGARSRSKNPRPFERTDWNHGATSSAGGQSEKDQECAERKAEASRHRGRKRLSTRDTDESRATRQSDNAVQERHYNPEGHSRASPKDADAPTSKSQNDQKKPGGQGPLDRDPRREKSAIQDSSPQNANVEDRQEGSSGKGEGSPESLDHLSHWRLHYEAYYHLTSAPG